MKEKIKKIIFGYLPGFITGLIVCGTISVIAATYFSSNDVTYDNTESGLTSRNVQGAIDELYGICTTEPTGEQIIEDAGLEKDPYECRYFFTGANPNNYITFNDETAGWRIMSVECDGTIKIIKDESIGNMEWDDSSSVGDNNWARPASLNTYLNSTYYNGLNSTSQSQIVAKDWSIGAVSYNDNNLANTINNENGTKWNGKVALPTASEYIRSNSDNINCGTMNQVYDYRLENNCGNTTWMHINDFWWTITSFYNNNTNVYSVADNGNFNRPFSTAIANTSRGIRPVLYLSQNIKITGGDGSKSNPYTIE